LDFSTLLFLQRVDFERGIFPSLTTKRAAAECNPGKGGVELTPAEAGAAQDGALLAVVEELAEGLPGADVGRRRPHHAHILVRTRFRHGSAAAAAAGRIGSDDRDLTKMCVHTGNLPPAEC
jgi:hypothetical protein